MKIKDAWDKFDLNMYLMYGVGVVGFLIPATRGLMKTLTPGFLLLMALYVYAKICRREDESKRKRLAVWSFLVIVVTIVLEILGVKFGLFFGEYDYGRVLGPAILGVPVIIGINWLIVIMGSTSLMRKVTSNLFVIVLGAGLCALLFDYIMEPAAIKLDFWDWEGGIPLKNYVSWTVITMVSAFSSELLGIYKEDKWSHNLLGAQMMFFASIRIFMIFNIF